MFKEKLSVILGNVGSCSDRYCPSYGRKYELEELFNRVAGIDGVSGVELIGNWHIRTGNTEKIKGLLKETGLKAVSIIPDHFSEAKWAKGAFTSVDMGLRREAVNVAKEAIDAAALIGCPLISLWPGQDGYDYMFCSDYIAQHGWFEEALAECCDYNPDMKISLEYKPKEPRIRSYPSNVYSTLLFVNSVNKANCGVTIDYGHAAMAYENVAESVAVLKKYGDKLFHLHMNDSYTLWDDDMIVGSVHTIAYLELFYWLKRTRYSGWISTDQYPYREDGRDAVNESIQWMLSIIDKMESMDSHAVDSIINSGDSIAASAMLRNILFH